MTAGLRRAPNLTSVVAVAEAHPSPWPRDIRAVIEGCAFDPPPWNVVIGKVRDRGGPSGRVVVGGRSLVEWGDTDRVDMAFSVTKSYIGLLAAVALDRGLIAGFDEPVSRRIDDPAFAGPRNATVTWRQLLDQTSEWSGTLFGLPDIVDRDRQLAPTDDPARFDRGTPLRAPGTYWDYNDGRVNALCLALTRLFDAPLPEVLAGIDPAFGPLTGAWDGWGERSTVALPARPVEIAVGGGHWGGGLSATVGRHGALGRLVLGRGALDGRRLLSTEALDALLTPCPLQPVYGGLWWLNTGRRLQPAASERAVFAFGVGMTAIWVEPERDLVAVARWITPTGFAAFVAAVAEALA